jgi:preprotein translocase subunit SecE
MATKAALVNGDDQPRKRRGLGPLEKVVDTWKEFTGFLGDVRAEMRKVVTPSRKEVQATTTVVIVTVFIFGVYFFLVDWIFGRGLAALLAKLGGMQQ